MQSNHWRRLHRHDGPCWCHGLNEYPHPTHPRTHTHTQSSMSTIGRVCPRCPQALWHVCGTCKRVRGWRPVEMPGGLGRLWEMSRQHVSAHCRPGGACLLGNRTKRDIVWRRPKCRLGEIVCPRDVPDVDSRWFANQELQAPGAMCKQ